MDFEPERHDPWSDWRDALGPWRPTLPTRPAPTLRPGPRAALMLAILAGHALVLWGLDAASGHAPEPARESITTLVFLAPEEPAVAPPPAPARPVTPPRRPEATRPVQTPRTPAPPAREPVAEPMPDTPGPPDAEPAPGTMIAVEPAPRTDAPLRLYGADGRIALPDDVVDRIAAVESDRRTFDFQLPGLADSGRFMERQPVLVYEATRFDRYWMPDQPELMKLLQKAVEATTGTVEIPIPGTRGGKLVCSVSVLALGGGCGVRNNSDGYVVQLDDPATLSPEEDARCRAWWDQIVAADDQATWRETRALYEFECRKPLAKALDPPD